jgi:DNA polymerase III epsilon subunit family exonuclease
LEPESGDRIVEIAGIRFKGHEKIADFQSLINPGRPICEAAQRVNKITPEMLQGAPTIDVIMPQFLSFIKNSCLCSYNATFDLEFLNNELKLMNESALEDTLVIDILKMARRLLPGLERYALSFVAGTLGIKLEQKHRALSDVELTLGVFNRLNAILKTKEIFDFRNFFSLFGLTFNLLEDINSQKIAKIQEALGLGVKLKIRYLSNSSAQVTEREVIPKEIRKDKNNLYLVGFCCLRNEERSFRIDGILHLEIL